MRRPNAAGGFNEAGAIEPRKLSVTPPPDPVVGRFNEAGAIEPRKHQIAADVDHVAGVASMRPGQ